MRFVLTKSFAFLILSLAIQMMSSCGKVEMEAEVEAEEGEVYSEPGPDLDPPENLVILELTDHSFTIEWQAVKNATHYRWDCDSSNQSAGGRRQDTKVSLDFLTPGTIYHFKVRAEDDTRTRPALGGDYPFYSDWTEMYFTTPEITE